MGVSAATPLPTGTPTWTSDLAPYAIPQTSIGTTSAGQIVNDPLQATISAAPALQRVADIVSGINQRAWMSAPGRQEQLANIQRMQAGQIDPSDIEMMSGDILSQYAGSGINYESPAVQAAFRRAMGAKAGEMRRVADEEMDRFYSGMPTTDVGRFTLTPSDYAAAMDAQRVRQLQLSELQQKGALETAGLAQQRALAEQELALKRQQYQQDVALRQQELELKRAAQAAALAQKGFTTGGTRIPLETPSYSDWIFGGYSRPTSYRRY